MKQIKQIKKDRSIKVVKKEVLKNVKGGTSEFITNPDNIIF